MASTPVPLTPDSFNQDMVVERSAPRPVLPATTASMETGWTNTGFSFFEKGYHLDWPATGLPAPGTVINSDMAMDHLFQFPPDYRSNNAVLINTTSPNAQIPLLTPARYSSLSLLLCGANDRANVPLSCAVHFQDGSIETNVVLCRDWMDTSSGVYAAYAANGRVDVTIFNFANLNSGLPMLFFSDITLTNASSVVSLEISYVRGSGQCALFGLSGAVEPGAEFTPIGIAGYNADLIVEATAGRPQALAGITTATMQTGAANTLWTWFEAGYVPGHPGGIPAAGSLLTNGANPNCVFALPASYTINNAVLLDSDLPTANLTPLEPFACSTLAFLAAAAGGTVTNLCVVQRADGSSETNTITCPDWTNSIVTPAFVANGRVNVNNRMLDCLASAEPRLFAIEIPVAAASSPVTNILLSSSPEGTNPTARIAIFALSAGTNAITIEPAQLAIEMGPSETIRIFSSAPGQLEFTTGFDGTNTAWQVIGPISSSLSIPIQFNGPCRFFRVVR